MLRNRVSFFNLSNHQLSQENTVNSNYTGLFVAEMTEGERPPTPPTPKQKRKADPESVTPLLINQPDPSDNTAGGMPTLNLNGQ